MTDTAIASATVAVEGPGVEADMPSTPPPPSRRRWPRRVALAVAAVAIVLLTAWAVAPGLLLRIAPVSMSFPADAPAAVVDGYAGPQGAYIVGYAHDEYMDVHLRLLNRGPLPIDVQDVALVMQEAPLLAPVSATVPGEVAAGQAAEASLEIRFDNCEAYHEREAMVVDHVAVTARVLGRTVVEQVPLDRPMLARSPMLWQCPDRTIDRSDDLRTAGG